MAMWPTISANMMAASLRILPSQEVRLVVIKLIFVQTASID